MGLTAVDYRASDDGEPHHSAGTPILGQITALDLTDVLVVVVRYYGGKKLGLSGLINAYRTAARLALEEAIIVQKELCSTFKLKCSYDLMYRIMQTVKKYQWDIREQEINENCIFLIDVKRSEKDIFIKKFTSLEGILFQEVSTD